MRDWLGPYFSIFILCSVVLIASAAWIPALWFLGFVALLPFYFVVDSVSRVRSFKFIAIFVFLTALVFAFPLLSYRSVQSLTPTGSQHLILDTIFLSYVLALAALAITALWAPLVFIKKWQWRVFVVPFAWVTFEFIKAKLSLGLQWVSVGEILVDFLPLGIFARFGGVLLLSFFLIGINISFYEGIKSLAEKRRIHLLFGVLMFWILLSAASASYMALYEKDLPSSKKLTVAVIQPGSLFEQKTKKNYFVSLARRTREAVRPEALPPVDLLIFPGNFFGSFRQENFPKNPAEKILGFRPLASTTIVGFTLVEGSLKYQANAVVFADKSEFAYKENLLPFADYIPTAINAVSGGVKKLASGYSGRTNNPIIFSDGRKVAIVSCSEEFIPSLFSRLTEKGAKVVIVSGSNDDFSSQTAYFEALRTSRLRALENGVWVIQAMKSGISAIINPLGRVTASLEKDEKGVLVGDIFYH